MSGRRVTDIGEGGTRALSLLAILAAAVTLTASAAAPAGELPNKPDSVKFAVIGDGGTGDRPQYEVAERMTETRRRFPFDLVLMVGDNFDGSQRPADLVKKFERPYKPLLDAGVAFQAAIENHDDASTVSYAPLIMDGRRYYTFARKRVRFFALPVAVLVGKPLGIAGAVALALAAGMHLPHHVGWKHVLVGAIASAVGFTLALFFAGAALPPGQLLNETRMGAILTVAGLPLAVATGALQRVGRFARPGS